MSALSWWSGSSRFRPGCFFWLTTLSVHLTHRWKGGWKPAVLVHWRPWFYDPLTTDSKCSAPCLTSLVSCNACKVVYNIMRKIPPKLFASHTHWKYEKQNSEVHNFIWTASFISLRIIICKYYNIEWKRPVHSLLVCESWIFHQSS